MMCVVPTVPASLMRRRVGTVASVKLVTGVRVATFVCVSMGGLVRRRRVWVRTLRSRAYARWDTVGHTVVRRWMLVKVTHVVLMALVSIVSEVLSVTVTQATTWGAAVVGTCVT